MKSTRFWLTTVWIAGLACLCLSQSLGAKPGRKPKVKSDCKFHSVPAGYRIAACLHPVTNEVTQNLEIKIQRGKKLLFRFDNAINPEGTYDDRVTIEGANQRFIGIAYDDTECTVVKVIDVSKKKVVYDSGCSNSSYYVIGKFPQDSQDCQMVVARGDGGGGEKRSTVSLCKK